MIWDHETLLLLGAIFTAALCTSYVFIDGWRLIRAFKSGTYDEKFGFVMSIVMVFTGLAGVVKHYWF